MAATGRCRTTIHVHPRLLYSRSFQQTIHVNGVVRKLNATLLSFYQYAYPKENMNIEGPSSSYIRIGDSGQIITFRFRNGFVPQHKLSL